MCTAPSLGQSSNVSILIFNRLPPFPFFSPSSHFSPHPNQLVKGSFKQAAQTFRAAESIFRMQTGELETSSTDPLKEGLTAHRAFQLGEPIQKFLGSLHDRLWDSPRLLIDGPVQTASFHDPTLETKSIL